MIKLLLLLLMQINSQGLYENQISILKDLPPKEAHGAFAQFYESNVKPNLSKKLLDQYDKKQFHNYVDALYEITFYTQNKSICIEYLRLFNLYQLKGWATQSDYKNMYSALIRNRLFKEAQGFYDAHKLHGLDALPKLTRTNVSKRKIIVYSFDKHSAHTLNTENFEFSKSKEIIMVAHPHCHFCFNAATAISKDQTLKQFFKKNVHLISPPDGNIQTEPLHDWFDRFPFLEIKYIANFSDFPMIDYWGTPTFYFLENGKVIDKITGWPKQGRMKELNSKINKHFSLTL